MSVKAVRMRDGSSHNTASSALTFSSGTPPTHVSDRGVTEEGTIVNEWGSIISKTRNSGTNSLLISMLNSYTCSYINALYIKKKKNQNFRRMLRN